MSQKNTEVKYNQYQTTINELTSKINQLKSDQEEHKIVIETLSKTSEERRCFRMIGGALIEKTVGETKPVLDLKFQNISKTLDSLTNELTKIINEFEKWKKDENIKIIKQ
ncbi:Prefoldin subunit 2 [Wickerhamomyces ciferrii]|uniref:Prefoldin subunit 2 n=1 Tax=Wickerhamomyces ciferrii (strain ATCC 14091 / BCRC 22168 / CBS 111 / JCM 3599 / NBRC 0793 / NRRL Y-1031 F-60-10) TaxID=1206466 RepID=K0KDD2_WICCF|nr:Prefoldin subunit 2 [Wickerhamomyces ciferrii]CCH40916.1 Prefoldin subunit 2 [Wickerhamomyces ciferrii]